MKRMKVMAAAIALLSVTACAGNDPASRCMQAQNYQECLQVADAGGDVGDYLAAGLAGYMLAKVMTPSGQYQNVIVENPSYRGYRRPIPSYARSHKTYYGAWKNKTVTTVTTKRGLFGNKTVTKTVTTTKAPAYKPSKSSWWGGSSKPYKSSYGSSYSSSRSYGSSYSSSRSYSSYSSRRR